MIAPLLVRFFTHVLQTPVMLAAVRKVPARRCNISLHVPQDISACAYSIFYYKLYRLYKYYHIIILLIVELFNRSN